MPRPAVVVLACKFAAVAPISAETREAALKTSRTRH